MRESKKKKGLIKIGIALFAAAFCILGYFVFIKAMDGKEITRGDYVVSISAKNRKVSIIGYNGDDEKVVIPKRMFLLPVTTISDSAFEDNQSIKEVDFPSTILAIGPNAFNNCTALEKVKFSGELNWIYDHAFFNCSSIKELSLPCSHDLQIEESAFESCISLESVNFNNGNVGMSTYAFYDCEKLETVQGTDGEIYATSDAFDNTAFLNDCDGDFFKVGSSLLKYLGNDKDVIVPEDVSRIASNAFVDKNISSIHMSSSVNSYWLYLRSDNSKLENKVQIYYGNLDEFDVPSVFYSCLKDNVVLVAPEDSAVIKYAKDNGIEYYTEAD